MTENEQAFTGWCIVELFGHQQIAGLVSPQVVAGTSFVRVDVPPEGGQLGEPGGFTKLYGAGAIYAITPTTEEIARAVAVRLAVRPVSPYMLSAPNAQPRGYDEELDGMGGDAWDRMLN